MRADRRLYAQAEARETEGKGVRLTHAEQVAISPLPHAKEKSLASMVLMSLTVASRMVPVP